MMNDLKEELIKYLCSQLHNGTKDLIDLAEESDVLNQTWYKDWITEMKLLLQGK